jgi:predicted transcriptional regulator
LSASENFKNNLSKLAEENKGLVGHIAAALGKSRSQIYSYFKSSTVPGLDIAEQVANAAGASLSEMIGEEKPNYAAPEMITPSPADLVTEMIRRFGVDQKRQRIIDFVLNCPDEYLKVLGSHVELMKERETGGKQKPLQKSK